MQYKLVKIQDLLILIIAAIIVAVVNFSTILKFIAGDSIDFLQQFTDSTNNFLSRMGNFFSENILTSNITTVIIWAAFGLIVYFFVSFLKIELQDVLKVFNLHGYVQPKNARTYTFLNVILELFFTFILAISLVAWLIYSTTVLLPTSSALMLVALFDSSSVLNSVLSIFLSIFTVFIIFYFPILLYRIMKITVLRLNK